MNDFKPQRCEFIFDESQPGARRCDNSVQDPTELEWEGETHILRLCPTHAAQFRETLGLLRKAFDAMRPAEHSGQSDDSAEAHDSESDGKPVPGNNGHFEDDYICEGCGKVIAVGNPFVRIGKTISFVEVNLEKGRDEIEIIEDEELLVFCGHCGNRFDVDAMVEFARDLPPISE